MDIRNRLGKDDNRIKRINTSKDTVNKNANDFIASDSVSVNIISDEILSMNNIIFVCPKDCDKSHIAEIIKKYAIRNINVNYPQTNEEYKYGELNVIPEASGKILVDVAQAVLTGTKSFLLGLSFDSDNNLLMKIKTLIALNSGLDDKYTDVLLESMSPVFVSVKLKDNKYILSSIDKTVMQNSKAVLKNIYAFIEEPLLKFENEEEKEVVVPVEDVPVAEEKTIVKEETNETQPVIEEINPVISEEENEIEEILSAGKNSDIPEEKPVIEEIIVTTESKEPVILDESFEEDGFEEEVVIRPAEVRGRIFNILDDEENNDVSQKEDIIPVEFEEVDNTEAIPVGSDDSKNESTVEDSLNEEQIPEKAPESDESEKNEESSKPVNKYKLLKEKIKRKKSESEL